MEKYVQARIGGIPNLVTTTSGPGTTQAQWGVSCRLTGVMQQYQFRLQILAIHKASISTLMCGTIRLVLLMPMVMDGGKILQRVSQRYIPSARNDDRASENCREGHRKFDCTSHRNCKSDEERHCHDHPADNDGGRDGDGPCSWYSWDESYSRCWSSFMSRARSIRRNSSELTTGENGATMRSAAYPSVVCFLVSCSTAKNGTQNQETTASERGTTPPAWAVHEPRLSAKIIPVPYAKLGDQQSLNLFGYVRNNPP